jgi:prephenate dehydrogenase/chorismate mutase
MTTTTESIVRLAKARQEIARDIARIKIRQGLPVENVRVERILKQRVNELAEEINLDRALASEILDVLLYGSKVAQRSVKYSKRIRAFLDKQGINSVSIVGAGRMGGWFGNYFKCLGAHVVFFDSDTSAAKRKSEELGCEYTESLSETGEADLIIVAVPINSTGSEIAKLGNIIQMKVKRPKAIIEIASVKRGLANAKNSSPVPVVSLHPLFGASADRFGKNAMIVIQSRNKKKENRFAARLTSGIFPQYTIIPLDARAHDKEMALQLSLPHALAIVFANLAASKKSPWSGKMGTPSYRTMIQFSGKVLAENPDVYYEIQSANQSTMPVLREFSQHLKQLTNYVGRDPHGSEKFARFFENARASPQVKRAQASRASDQDANRSRESLE